jgi:CubicO group peptidase (beta-lactamase class C family)
LAKKPKSLRNESIAAATLFLALTLSIAPICLPATKAAVRSDPSTNVTSTQLISTQTNGPTDPKELETFIDTEISEELQKSGVPGATVAVVKDGQLLFAKGYGTANRADNIPVVANQTLFRIASVTKLFTWTAVMQLVEQGKLDLDADVNKYIKTFQIPATYPQPITLKNLMSHSAGFESDDTVGWVPTAGDLKPLGYYLAHNIPARVRPPSELSVYSNYGASLAGYIVEQVSGMPFDDYVKAKILDPLGMHHTTTQEPLPSNLASDMSMSYIYRSGSLQAVPLGYYNGKPAGAMCSTATDIANFMIAHLQNGTCGNSTILQNTTAKLMHSQLFTMDPRAPGFAYGFQEYYVNGQRIIGHFGALDSFYSSLMLIPQENLGWFVAYNCESGIASPGAFFIAFLNHYFPVEASASPSPPADFLQRANQFTGTYRDARISHTNFNKLNSLSSEVQVTSTLSGTLMMKGGQYVEVEPLMFKPYNSPNPWNDSLVFLRNSRGQISNFFTISGVYERVPLFETASFTWSVIGVSLVFFISMLILLPARAFIDSRKGGEKKAVSKWARWSGWLSGCFSLLFVISIIGILIAHGNIAIWYAVMTTVLIGSALGVASVPFVGLAWKKRYWGLSGRLHYTTVTSVALVFIWLMNNWNVLGFRV